MENNKYLIPLSVVVAGALVAGAIYFGDSNPNNEGTTRNQSRTAEELVIPPVSASDHIIGNPNAAVVIVEYSDTECPWCKVFHETMWQIVTQYEGQVAWVYRHMPFHNKSLKESQATECAAEIGGNDAFWQYLNRVFEITPSNDGLDLDLLPQIAQEIGLNTSSFNECLSSDRHLEDIEKNLELAKPGGITGTPFSIIMTTSGEENYINGAEPAEMIRAKIDSIIEN